jgi:serine/threonine protein kinase
MQIPNQQTLRLNASGTNPYGGGVAMPDGSQRVPLGSGYTTALLGDGGMATVYEIWNQQLEVARAVKVMHPNCDAEARNRFQTEMKISAKLHHPNIVEIHGVGEWQGLPYIEMERMSGIGLRELLDQRGALPLDVCTSIAIMIGRALKHAHCQEYQIYETTYRGVIHRDLKPNNVMVCSNGLVKLMDFGIARPIGVSFHTIDGTVVGTLQYLSPEQMDGSDLDERTDIYSLGATLYEILCGKPAFPQENISQLMSAKSRNAFIPLADYPLHLPAALIRLVHHCMQQDRNKRPPSVAALLAELDKIHKNLTTASPEQVVERFLSQHIQTPQPLRPTAPRRSRKRLIAATAAVSLITITGATLFILFGERVGEYLTHQKQTAAPTPLPPTTAQPVSTPTPQPAQTAQTTAPQRQPAQTARPALVPAPTAPTSSAPRSPGASVQPTTAPPPQAVAAVEPAGAPPRRQPSFVDALRDRYATDDLLTILTREMRAGNHTTALQLYDSLPPAQSTQPTALLLKLRALEALGGGSRYERFVMEHQANDAEFFLAKARIAFKRSDLERVEPLLAQAATAPRLLIDGDSLALASSLLAARLATRRFELNPSAQARTNASGKWYEIKARFRNDMNHPWFKLAEQELGRIGELFEKQGG